MTRRPIVTTLIFTVALIGAGSVGAAASQKPAVEEPGSIRGVVTRVGSREPLIGAQVTLQGGAANPQAIQILVNTAASQGIVVKPEPGATTSQIIQALSNAAIARGFPLTTSNLYTQLASLSGKTVAGLTPDLYLADVLHKAVSVFHSGFDVRPGENDTIQVLVGSGAGTVDGVVNDGPEKAVAGATVALVPEALHRENLALYLSAATDAAGRFVMRGVPPGDYKLFAWESVRPFAYQNATFIAKDENRGRFIHVGEDNTVKAELTVIH